jgi:hypothetical protein
MAYFKKSLLLVPLDPREIDENLSWKTQESSKSKQGEAS